MRSCQGTRPRLPISSRRSTIQEFVPVHDGEKLRHDFGAVGTGAMMPWANAPGRELSRKE